jgi:hypothetical protein
MLVVCGLQPAADAAAADVRLKMRGLRKNKQIKFAKKTVKCLWLLD